MTEPLTSAERIAALENPSEAVKNILRAIESAQVVLAQAEKDAQNELEPKDRATAMGNAFKAIAAITKGEKDAFELARKEAQTKPQQQTGLGSLSRAVKP